MILSGVGIRIKDTSLNKKGTTLTAPQCTFQQATSGAAGAPIPGTYQPPPALANFFVLIAYDDFTIGVQTFNNITLLKS